MSDQNEVQTPTELETLQKRAAQLNIQIDGRWGVEKLREVVNAAVAGDKEPTKPAEVFVAAAAATTAAPVAQTSDEIVSPVAVTQMPDLSALAKTAEAGIPENETEGQLRNRLKREATALVRVNVSCMDPSKKKLKGELLCVSNKNFGTIQRFIPFNRDWHIEKVLYDELNGREFMVFDREKTGRAGIEVVTPRNVPAFNIRVLPPLTKGELKDLGQRQAMANGTSE